MNTVINDPLLSTWQELLPFRLSKFEVVRYLTDDIAVTRYTHS